MLQHIFSFFRAIPRFIFACLKGFAALLLCGILAIILSNLILTLPGPSVSSLQVEKNLPKLQPSAEYKNQRSIIRLYDASGQFFCTGVVIGANYALTASHCLVDEEGVMRKEHVHVLNDDKSISVDAKPAGVNLRMDWGLLHGDFSKIPGSLVFEVGFEASPGVIACGYPHGANAITCQVLVPYMNDGFFIKCQPGGMLFPGMSGGPVFDKEGHLVGLNIAAYPAAQRGGVAYSPVTSILACFGIAD